MEIHAYYLETVVEKRTGMLVTICQLQMAFSFEHKISNEHKRRVTLKLSWCYVNNGIRVRDQEEGLGILKRTRKRGAAAFSRNPPTQRLLSRSY